MHDLDIVILAAGKGTRMRSPLPKVLHTLAGKPMVQHVLETAQALNPARTHVVIGHGADQLREALAEHDVLFALQEEQKGTGHAVVDLVAGQINLMFDSLSTVIPNEKAGKVRMIGLTSSQRSACFSMAPKWLAAMRPQPTRAKRSLRSVIVS